MLVLCRRSYRVICYFSFAIFEGMAAPYLPCASVVGSSRYRPDLLQHRTDQLDTVIKAMPGKLLSAPSEFTGELNTCVCSTIVLWRGPVITGNGKDGDLGSSQSQAAE